MTNYVATPASPANSLTLSAGDTLTVTAGATGTADTVFAGGLETVSGTATGELVTGLVASLGVAAGGMLLGAHVVSGASLFVLGSASGTVLSAGSTSAVIGFGGTASATTVDSRADLAVDGTAHGIAVQSLGTVEVFGAADGIVVQSGGAVTVALGTITGTILSGGTETVLGTEANSGFLASGTQVFAGGTVRLGNGGTDTGTVLGAGGQEIVGAGSLADAPIISGGSLELATSSGAADGSFSTASFAGTGGRLQIDGTGAQTGAITGFARGDRIIFAGLPASLGASLAVSGDRVTVTQSGVADTLDVVGASSLPLQLVMDAATGGEAIGVACYCAGTAILTENGERPVEEIGPGDRVITADGRAERVVWTGRRSYAGRFLAAQLQLLPIRISAGALGGGLPRRDLLVSPCHAMLLDGMLVQAGSLTNGCTIVQERTADRVDYVHVELARHDVILAEGAASETYLDGGNRMMFANAESYRGSGNGGDYCAPRAADGYRVEAIRRHLAALAGTLSQAA